MITVENVSFSLEMKTDAGWITVPALHRQEGFHGEGSLQLIFSEIYGVKVKGYRLQATNLPDAGETLVGTMVELPQTVQQEFDGFSDECFLFTSVQLTPAQLEQITEELNIKAEAAAEAETDNYREIRAEYLPVDDGVNVRHCVTAEHHWSVENMVVRGVNAARLIVALGGFVDEEYRLAGIVTVKARFSSREWAECFVNSMREMNRVAQAELKRRDREEATEAEPAAV